MRFHDGTRQRNRCIIQELATMVEIATAFSSRCLASERSYSIVHSQMSKIVPLSKDYIRNLYRCNRSGRCGGLKKTAP